MLLPAHMFDIFLVVEYLSNKVNFAVPEECQNLTWGYNSTSFQINFKFIQNYFLVFN